MSVTEEAATTPNILLEAKDIVQSVREDYPEDVDRETALHESVDGAVPIYYSDLAKVLLYTDIGHRKVEDEIHDGTAFNLLQVAIYDELYEKASELLEDSESEEEDEEA
ncbi:hypothetical protein LCGC14_2996420 [marine sediment metagenome]|uniref:Uncharacterized protein n=1 Tax=marine sediment metagenome TaxID=412755 RepID=A0A0F8ZTG1_9ZZZZ